MYKYTQATIFTKRTNLLQYFENSQLSVCSSREIYNWRRENYAQEREVELILMERWEHGKCFCKIKCPINPLPVKGEFEVPSIGAIGRFLRENGWAFKQRFYLNMFK